MSKLQQLILGLTSLLLISLQAAEGQGLFGRPLFGNFVNRAEMVRFANTACRGDGNESGTCLTAADCERKGGTSSGPCGNGAGVCCSFKVSAGQPTTRRLEMTCVTEI